METAHYGSTSAHRANALKRIGHTIFLRDPDKALFAELRWKWLYHIHYRTGFKLIQRFMLKWLKSEVEKVKSIDVVWIDSGELFGLECIKFLKSIKKPVVLFNVDDPTGSRDGHRFDSLIEAIPEYDLIVVVRKERLKRNGLKLDAKKVLRLFRSYDEVAHRP